MHTRTHCAIHLAHHGLCYLPDMFFQCLRGLLARQAKTKHSKAKKPLALNEAADVYC